MKKVKTEDLDYGKVLLDPDYFQNVAIPHVKSLDRTPENIILLGYGIGFVAHGINNAIEKEEFQEMLKINSAFILEVFVRILTGEDVDLTRNDGADKNDKS